MRQIAGRLLWIGNPGDTRDVRDVLDAGIEAVVELADNEPIGCCGWQPSPWPPSFTPKYRSWFVVLEG